ncbi:hypothetical protein HMPREF1624_01776 [Sporothrix schenckii ATCC 58251]|uniref:Nucleolar protein 12 n=1 Tax=Sporothrix schenckii (strain ATCC 58251 / de Perez 2211183) TaxID=1391915 RepID=U7Q9L8_SPOS1|nr:hypothetical protein HMPREF1624_01776 [Sporothrix schenckii ATCC 58251]
MSPYAARTDIILQVGPVEANAKPKYEPLVSSKPRAAPKTDTVQPLTKEEKEASIEDSEENDDEDRDDEDDDSDSDDSNDDEAENDESADASAQEEAPFAVPTGSKTGASKRKRKTQDENDDLENRYFDKLEKEIGGPVEKKAKHDASEAVDSDEVMADGLTGGEEIDDADEPIIHESLLNAATGGAEDGSTNGQIDEQNKAKADRTVFLSNVSISAVTNKTAKKTLISHLESIRDDKAAKDKESKETRDGEDDEEKQPTVESLRFRSVPFSSAALPKRTSFITKSVMGATAQSCNAYVVYSTAAAARTAVRKLNGTVVLDRHLRVDSVAHPAPVDHKRCVFVGNLGFVDDETVLSANPDTDGDGGEMTRKKRNKTPMDIDEGLWRTFGKHAGKVESVRVVRDQVTRVGKGFAYVQFYDATSVEAALLLNDKKYPPLLPRTLRVSRCKAPYKTARAIERAQRKVNGKPEALGTREGRGRNSTTGYKPKLTAEQQTSAGRAAKLLGKSAATAPLGAAGPDGKPMVFEGMRARVGGVNLFKKSKGGKKGGGPRNGPPGSDASRKKVRQAGRAANWRAKKGGNA